MDRTVAKFSSHEEAEKANREYYRSLTPQQRLEILFELVAQAHPENDASIRQFERVCRIVKFSQG
jgi:hypothetical protein